MDQSTVFLNYINVCDDAGDELFELLMDNGRNCHYMLDAIGDDFDDANGNTNALALIRFHDNSAAVASFIFRNDIKECHWDYIPFDANREGLVSACKTYENALVGKGRKVPESIKLFNEYMEEIGYESMVMPR